MRAKILREKLEVALKEKNKLLTKVYNQLPMDLEPRYMSGGAYREGVASERMNQDAFHPAVAR